MIAVFGAIAVAGCSMDVDYFSVPDFKRPQWTFTRPDWTIFAKDDHQERPIGAEDLIGADGRCAGDPAVVPAEAQPPGPQALYFTAGPQAARPEAGPPMPAAPQPTPGAPIARGIALRMTECEVMHTIGLTDRVEVSTNERGQRSVLLTYLRGDRPGIYRFVAGRLVSIERAPEPPAPPKPEKKTAKKPAKKPSNS